MLNKDMEKSAREREKRACKTSVEKKKKRGERFTRSGEVKVETRERRKKRDGVR